MTFLRQRMLEDLQLRGLAPKTQEAYIRAVRQLAEHYGKSPDRITEGYYSAYPPAGCSEPTPKLKWQTEAHFRTKRAFKPAGG